MKKITKVTCDMKLTGYFDESDTGSLGLSNDEGHKMHFLLLHLGIVLSRPSVLLQCLNHCNSWQNGYEIQSRRTTALCLIFLSFSYGAAHAPLHTSTEACVTGWPNAQPEGED